LGEASACRGGLEHANNFPLTFSTAALNHRHGSHRLEKRKGHSECRRTHRRASPAGRFAEARMKHKIISCYVGFVVFLIGCSVLSGSILSVLSPLCFFRGPRSDVHPL
jgi:hypothetical protein